MLMQQGLFVYTLFAAGIGINALSMPTRLHGTALPCDVASRTCYTRQLFFKEL